MHRLRTSLAIGLLLPVLFLSTACKSGNGLVLALQGIVDVASIAISVVTAGDPSATLALTYAQNVSQASAQAITELRSTDTTAVKIEKSVGYFVAAAAPVLKPGTSNIIIVSVNAITSSVELFLSQLKATQTVITAHGITTQQADVMVIKMNLSDRAMLSTIMSRAKANVSAAQAKK